MPNYFFITSAIQTPYSYVNPDVRFQQTLGTVSSIDQYCPDSRSVLIEVGPKVLTSQQHSQLVQCCFAVLDLTNDHTVKLIHHCGGEESYGWVKTPGEIYALICALGYQRFVTDHDRVFKISGRYQLTQKFDIRDHQLPGRLVVAQSKPAVQYVDPQGNHHPRISQYQYPTRLYSFCGSMVSIMQQKYQIMFEQVIEFYGRMQFVDVEHMMYSRCRDLDPIELGCVGISGQQSPDGEWIQE